MWNLQRWRFRGKLKEGIGVSPLLRIYRGSEIYKRDAFPLQHLKVRSIYSWRGVYCKARLCFRVTHRTRPTAPRLDIYYEHDFGIKNLYFLWQIYILPVITLYFFKGFNSVIWGRQNILSDVCIVEISQCFWLFESLRLLWNCWDKWGAMINRSNMVSRSYHFYSEQLDFAVII